MVAQRKLAWFIPKRLAVQFRLAHFMDTADWPRDPARMSGHILEGLAQCFGVPQKIAGPSQGQNVSGSAQCDLAPVSPGKFDAMLPSHRRNTSCLPFGTSAAGPATIRSAFMIEADRTLTAAACPQMTQSGRSLDYAIQKGRTENQGLPYRVKSRRFRSLGLGAG